MPNPDEAKAIIVAAFRSAWGTATPIVLDNTALDTRSEWASASVQHTAGEQESLGPIGGRRFYRYGTLVVRTYTPENKGTTRADALEAIVRNAFEAKTISSIVFMVVSSYAPPARAPWYVMEIRAPFWYLDHK